jgi:transposase-like protein
MSRRKFNSDFKVKVVLEALSDRYTIQELGRKYDSLKLKGRCNFETEKHNVKRTTIIQRLGYLIDDL